MLKMFANCFFTLFEYPRWRMTSVFALQSSGPKHVIKNLRFLSISQIKLFENETNIVVTTDFCLYCFR